MNKTNRQYSVVKALELATGQAGVKPSDLRSVDLTLDESGLYIISFCDDWMSYCCYIDIFNEHVLGFLSEPLSAEYYERDASGRKNAVNEIGNAV
ncbi:MAG: hypothetical protein IKF99_07440 [Oscillospiraceae bacterium]|nr:hypothetical protein [Oscillospiraceae bacterium]